MIGDLAPADRVPGDRVPGDRGPGDQVPATASVPPKGPLVSWWDRRSLRTRLVILSIVPLTAALVVGTVSLVILFSAGRIHDLDLQTRQQSGTLAGLAATGQLTSPLPLAPGSPLLAQVISPSGVVLAASSSASLVLPLVLPGPSEVRSLDTTDEDNPYGAVPLRLHEETVRTSNGSVLIVVAAPLGDVRHAVQSLKIGLLLLIPALVVVAALLEWAVIGLTLRPVERLRSAAGALAEQGRLARGGGGSPPAARASTQLLPVSDSDDEISRLGHTLNTLLRQLHDALSRERDFLVDAAHELRSPLASIHVQLDVAGAHPELITTTELAAGLSREVDRLTRLTDDLLTLGRLEAGAPGPPVIVDLTELADVTGPPVLVLGQHQDLQRLIRNLTDNAHSHAGTVQVTIAETYGFAVLNVDDDGPGITPADRNRVFQRWTRLDPARDRGTGGFGLGLALVGQIAVAHAGQVIIADSPLGGTRVQVRLPVAKSPAPPMEGPESFDLSRPRTVPAPSYSHPAEGDRK